MGGMGWMMGSGWMNAVVWINLLFGLGLLALLVVGVIAGIRWLVNDASASGAPWRPDRGLDILRERYARGEISRDEYERMHQDLS